MSARIQYINHPLRPSTGPLKFDEDWPGVFIRGDEALSYAHSLEKGNMAVLPELIDLLNSCRVDRRED